MKLRLPLPVRKLFLALQLSILAFASSMNLAYAEAQNLVVSDSILVWDTQYPSFVDENGTTTTFSTGDNVNFTRNTQVTLCENIEAGILTVEAGANVKVNKYGYELDAERIVLSGTLDMGAALYVTSGSTLELAYDAAVLKSELVLGNAGTLSVSEVASLGGNKLTLQGGTALNLDLYAAGRVCTLMTNVGGLLDAEGKTIVLNASNNRASLYFDTSLPGTGFWEDATVVLTSGGSLQLVRHTLAMKNQLSISSRLTGSKSYDYYTILFVDDFSTTSNGGAVSGVYGDSISFCYNGHVQFEDNEANVSIATNGSGSAITYGGAIYSGAGCVVALNDNGTVEFERNAACATLNTSSSASRYVYTYGGAIYNGSSLEMRDNSHVLFKSNEINSKSYNSNSSYSTYSYAYGGAICGAEESSTIVDNNGYVEFSENLAYAMTDNRSGGDESYAYGGAIYGSADSVVALTNNGSLVFSNNAVDATNAYGGAVYGTGSSDIRFVGNGSLLFDSNRAGASSAYGGVIAVNELGEVSLNDNKCVTFSGNRANTTYYSSAATYYSSAGGAVWVEIDGKFEITGSDSVEFIENVAHSSSSSGYSYGGAMSSGGTVLLSNNDSIVFRNNIASATKKDTYGGAIACANVFTIKDNGRVEFVGNQATYGGAIRGTAYYSDVTFCGNERIVFDKNKATYGGAIHLHHSCPMTFSDNTSVIFSGNEATMGSAIYIDGASRLNIRNNDSVIFEKNVELTSAGYLLRSIYAKAAKGEVSLSAAAEKRIEFRDSVYIGANYTVDLNADYVNSKNQTIKQTGDIVFTGSYTVNYLDELYKGTENSAGADEILASRTSLVEARTNLYGGRLCVEDGAVYKGHGITVYDKSNATVRVKDAELSHVGYTLEFNAGTTLAIAGESTVRGNVELQKDSTLYVESDATLNMHRTLGEDHVKLTLTGSTLFEGNSTLNVSLLFGEGSTLDMNLLESGSVTLNGALIFSGQNLAGDNLLRSLELLQEAGESLTLFTGITSLSLPALVSTEEEQNRVYLGDVFSNVANEATFYFNFDEVSGSLSLVRATSVPEPTSTTLSLLALAGLVARRRRS